MPKSKVLVVDDEPDVREIIRFYLEEDGYAVIEASSGKEAIKQAEKERPDLITLDIIMPELDGFEVIASLKENPATKAIPIIILSILEDQDGYRQGIADYICKPFEKEELLKRIHNTLGRISKAEAKGQEMILIVDDEPDVVEIIKLYVEDANYRSCEAFNGLEALDKIQQDKPDLIILDINMPKMDGYEVIKRIKKDPASCEIPVIVLTGVMITEKDKKRGLKLGASRYLTKPFKPEVLIEEIKATLKMRKEK